MKFSNIKTIFIKEVKDSIKNSTFWIMSLIPIILSLIICSTSVFAFAKLPLLALFVIIAMMLLAVFIGESLAEEKEKKTLDVLLISPASINDIIWGKALFGLITMLTVSVLVLLLNRGFSGNIPFLFIILLLGSIVSVEGGLLLGCVTPNQRSAGNWGTIILSLIILPLSLGRMVPFFHRISLILPPFYVTEGLRKCRTEANLNKLLFSDQLWWDITMLVIFSVIIFFGISFALKRERK